jgi:hypothetical protein
MEIAMKSLCRSGFPMAADAEIRRQSLRLSGYRA